MRDDLREAIQKATKSLFDLEIKAELTRPEEEFGDFTSNVAMQIAGKAGKKPREIAEQIVSELKKQDIEATVADPGFINIRLSDKDILAAAQDATSLQKDLKDKTIVAEYSDPNPFKVLHAGHVYTTVVGDAISNLFEAAGAKVHRVHYGGDVGLHVGKTMWAILQELGGEYPVKLKSIASQKRSVWLAERYVEGTTAYEEDEKAKAQIISFNKKIYKIHADNDHSSDFAIIYWACRQWSYDSFDVFYKRLGAKLEGYYPESEVAELGLRTVKEQKGKVFEESDGAIVFKGEKYGLHTRVFINSEGLPTYEAKDVGLIIKKNEDYHFDRSIVVTGNEQQQYMAVVLKAIEQFLPDLAQKTTYVPHGMVKLAGGRKMSSRKGNIIPASEVLDVTIEANKKINGSQDNQVAVGAIKYGFLKVRLGVDLIYDPKESVSLQGNSGPYLQYALVRAKSILGKEKSKKQNAKNEEGVDLTSGERTLVRKITEYPDAFQNSLNDLSPHHVANYLYDLAQTFNRFYEKNRVIDDPRSELRLNLVRMYADVLESGLKLLGMPIPEKM